MTTPDLVEKVARAIEANCFPGERFVAARAAIETVLRYQFDAHGNTEGWIEFHAPTQARILGITLEDGHDG